MGSMREENASNNNYGTLLMFALSMLNEGSIKIILLIARHEQTSPLYPRIEEDSLTNYVFA